MLVPFAFCYVIHSTCSTKHESSKQIATLLKMLDTLGKALMMTKGRYLFTYKSFHVAHILVLYLVLL